MPPQLLGPPFSVAVRSPKRSLRLTQPPHSSPHGSPHSRAAAQPAARPRPPPVLSAADAASADAAALLRSLKSLSKADKAVSLKTLLSPSTDRLLSLPAALSPAACAALRLRLRQRADRKSLDSVDGLPEVQLTLSRQELEGVVGASAVAALWALPRALDAAAPARFTQVRCFARLYAAGASRSDLGLHTDVCDWTVNVSLSPPAAYAGGELVLLHGSRARAVARAEGEATCHHWSVVHGVAPVTAGERASLLLFFYHRRRPAA